MTFYLISDPAKPWLTVFSSSRLEAVAEALAAQSHFEPSSLYASLDGKSRPLDDAERTRLFELVLKLSPDHPAAVAALNAIGRDQV
ncbi:MAG TPA: hypothetical protein VHU61_01375 [Solirubrobacteraceae bacterium]|jgi:hypothetical protein|nr:hypothetical protein [Solirubrobacteraceae bacterium]